MCEAAEMLLGEEGKGKGVKLVQTIVKSSTWCHLPALAHPPCCLAEWYCKKTADSVCLKTAMGLP